MIISGLEVQNFKSYNDLNCFGPFDPHFNCVIGPNGNGKSNIIDAVLFVFGFKSSKLRQDNLASLIHTSAFARPDFATVTVVFYEAGIYTRISRTVYRSGHSYYRFNGNKIGWTELRQQLINKCIDLNKNLFIILQGQVQRLCELSPDKMVEYLEYVSGSDQYKEPIDEAEKKFIQQSILKEQMRATITVKRKVYESLKDTASKQSTWLSLQLQTILAQHLVLKKTFLDTIKAVHNLTIMQDQQKAILAKLQDDFKHEKQAIQGKKMQLKTIIAECGKGEQYIERLQQKINGINHKIKQMSRQLNFLAKDKQKKQGEKSRINKQSDELIQISKQHQQLQNSTELIKNQLKKFGPISKLNICAELEQKLSKLHEQQKQTKKACQKAKSNLEIDRRKLNDYAVSMIKNKQLISSLRKDLKKNAEERGEIDAKLIENEESLAQIQHQLAQKPSQKIISIQQKIINQVRAANKAKIICNQITLSTLREYIIVEAAYLDVVETILPHLDFFIVDNIQQAKQIMEYLVKKKLGRTTVLIRDSIKQATKDAQFPTYCPKDTKLLIEVCKCSDRQIKSILFWILGTTLVTNKLETAMKVAYYDEKTYRVITTCGELIDLSGTITKLPLKRGVRQQDQQILLKKQFSLKKQIQALKQQSKKAGEKRQQLQEKLKSIESQQRSFDGLDEVFIEDQQSKIRQMQKKLLQIQSDISENIQMLSKIQNQVKDSNFDFSYYEHVLLQLNQLRSNQYKIKKIENSANLHISLNKKLSGITAQISKLGVQLLEKMKNKNILEGQKCKLTELLQAKNKEYEVIKYAKTLVEEQIKTLQKGKKNIEDQLSDSNRKSSYPQPRQQLRKIKVRLRNIQIERLQILSKLFDSIKQIKQFTEILHKTIYSKCPQLMMINPQDITNISIKTIIQNFTFPFGPNQYKFTDFLSNQESELLFKNSKYFGNIYNQESGIRPHDSQMDILFEAIASKDLKFSHSFELQKLKHFQKQMMKGQSTEVDFQMFDEYIEHKKDFEKRSQQLSQLSQKIQIIKGELITLRNKRLDIFLTCFNQINIELNKIYMQLTGGKAEINLVDSMNPLEGVQFSVRPVNKSWKRVNLLSGGQKTFTSLALIFACEEIKKFPFYFMDQIDAALDYRNTTLLAQYITSKKDTQHIVISLRKNMYQECNRVIGIYKIQDQSRKIQLSMNQIRSLPQLTN